MSDENCIPTGNFFSTRINFPGNIFNCEKFIWGRKNISPQPVWYASMLADELLHPLIRSLLSFLTIFVSLATTIVVRELTLFYTRKQGLFKNEYKNIKLGSSQGYENFGLLYRKLLWSSLRIALLFGVVAVLPLYPMVILYIYIFQKVTLISTINYICVFFVVSFWASLFIIWTQRHENNDNFSLIAIQQSTTLVEREIES